MKHSFLYIVILSLNFCIVKLPPITFTQSGTAAEKQMIGENKTIEKDGWILSSIRTSALGSEIWKREILSSDTSFKDEDDELVLHLKRIGYFAPETKKYKQKGFIGEALDGKLKVNPIINQTKYLKEFGEIKERVEEVLKLTNESREIITKKKFESYDKEEKDPLKNKNLKSKYILTFYNLTEDGEYFEMSKSKWVKKE